MRSVAAKRGRITASQLRADVYNILDQVIETGEPVEIERKGATVRLVPEKKRRERKKKVSKLDRLKEIAKPDLWVGDPNDIFHMDYLEEWREEWGIKDKD